MDRCAAAVSGAARPGSGPGFPAAGRCRTRVGRGRRKGCMAATMADSSRGAALVLVADRDPMVRELAEHFLVVAGFQVEIVLDGASALVRARELRPDVVLTEVMLPRLDGL